MAGIRSAYPSMGDMIQDLANQAAADANHDFAGGRGAMSGAFGGLTFRKFFSEGSLKQEIGTPTKPDAALQSEYEIMNRLMGFASARSKSESDQVNDFRDTFLVDQRVGEFQVYPGLTQNWVSSYLGKKEGEEYRWDGPLSSEAQFRLLSGGKESVSIVVDAASVKFQEVLAKDKGAPIGRAIFLSSREGMNDATGNISMESQAKKTATGHVIRIEEVGERAGIKMVLYPAFDAKKGVDPKSLFYSKQSVSIEPGKLDSVQTTFSNSNFTKIVQVSKGRKEDHPNAVNTLLSNLMKFVKFISSKITQKGKDEQNILLQQKRAGDWLQVLSCLDPSRFTGATGKERILLVTEDRICAAQAIAMGVDVLFTQHHESQFWTILFHTPRESVSQEGQLFRYLTTSLPKPEFAFGDRTEGQGETLRQYLEEKQRREQAFSSEIPAVLKEIQGALQEVREKGVRIAQVKATIETLFRKFLRPFLNVSSWRLLVPMPQGSVNEDRKLLVEASRDETVVKARQAEVKVALANYEANLRNIQLFLKGAEGKAEALDVKSAINQAFNSIVALTSREREAEKERIKLLDNLRIFDGVFQPANAKKNAAGIFPFLNIQLLDHEKRFLSETMNRLQRALITLSSDLTYRNQLRDFFDIIRCLSLDEAAPPAAVVPESVLTGTILNLDAPEPMHVEEDEEDPPSDLKISPFVAATKILRERAVKVLKRSMGEQGEGRSTRGRMAGGAVEDHQPLTTFFFLLREVILRIENTTGMVQEDALRIGQFLFQISNSSTEALSHAEVPVIREYQSLLEAIFLGVLTQLDEVSEEFQRQVEANFHQSQSSVQEFFMNVSSSYYGASSFPDLVQPGQVVSMMAVLDSILKGTGDVDPFVGQKPIQPEEIDRFVEGLRLLQSSVVELIGQQEAIEHPAPPVLKTGRSLTRRMNVRMEAPTVMATSGGKRSKRKTRRRKN